MVQCGDGLVELTLPSYSYHPPSSWLDMPMCPCVILYSCLPPHTHSRPATKRVAFCVRPSPSDDPPLFLTWPWPWTLIPCPILSSTTSSSSVRPFRNFLSCPKKCCTFSAFCCLICEIVLYICHNYQFNCTVRKIASKGPVLVWLICSRSALFERNLPSHQLPLSLSFSPLFPLLLLLRLESLVTDLSCVCLSEVSDQKLGSWMIAPTLYLNLGLSSLRRIKDQSGQFKDTGIRK